jgi:hypothetical protein
MLSTRYGVPRVYAALEADPVRVADLRHSRHGTVAHGTPRPSTPAILLVGATPLVTATTALFASASTAWLCVTGDTSARASLPLKHTVYVITDSCQQHRLWADCFAPTG